MVTKLEYFVGSIKFHFAVGGVTSMSYIVAFSLDATITFKSLQRFVNVDVCGVSNFLQTGHVQQCCEISKGGP